MLDFFYITNDPKLAKICEDNGVQRIFVDLEWKGKAKRQGHIDSVKSFHSIQDIVTLRKIIKKSLIMVRINPMDQDSATEINAVIAAGADMIMLPMAQNVTQVMEFTNIVNKRVRCILLLETRGAEQDLEKILQLKYIDEVHIGLNDLSLDYGMQFMFDLLGNGTVEKICNILKKYNIPFGFGGIGRIGQGKLPAERILLEHRRLGSTRVILSRSFYNASSMQNYAEAEQIFTQELKKIRQVEKDSETLSQKALLENLTKIQECCNEH